MGLGGVAIATLPSVICAKLMFSDGLGGKTLLLFLLYKAPYCRHTWYSEALRLQPLATMRRLRTRENLHAPPSALQALALHARRHIEREEWKMERNVSE